MSALISLHEREREEGGRRDGGRERGREGWRESNTMGGWMKDKSAGHEAGGVWCQDRDVALDG